MCRELTYKKTDLMVSLKKGCWSQGRSQGGREGASPSKNISYPW
jgi:hypothetical protein